MLQIREIQRGKHPCKQLMKMISHHLNLMEMIIYGKKKTQIQEQILQIFRKNKILSDFYYGLKIFFF